VFIPAGAVTACIVFTIDFIQMVEGMLRLIWKIDTWCRIILRKKIIIRQTR